MICKCCMESWRINNPRKWFTERLSNEVNVSDADDCGSASCLSKAEAGY